MRYTAASFDWWERFPTHQHFTFSFKAESKLHSAVHTCSHSRWAHTHTPNTFSIYYTVSPNIHAGHKPTNTHSNTHPPMYTDEHSLMPTNKLMCTHSLFQLLFFLTTQFNAHSHYLTQHIHTHIHLWDKHAAADNLTVHTPPTWLQPTRLFWHEMN